MTDKILYTSDGTNLITIGSNTVNHNVTNTISIGNSSVNSSINSTSFSGTSNNSLNLGGVAAANVVSNAQLQSNLSNYQTTAGLSANVATLAANSSTYANQSVTNTFTVGTSAYHVSNGNMGIGTSSPNQKLAIYSGTNYQLRFDGGSPYYYDVGRNASDGLLYFYGGQTGYTGYVFSGVDGEKMRIDSSGNMGIGTSSPSAAGGNINFILNTSGDVSIIKSSTTSTGSSAVARFDQSIGTAGAYTIMGLYNNSGNPYWIFSAGSGVTGAVYFTNGSGGVYLAKNDTSWTANSDENLKNITGTIQDGLSKVLSLRAAKFTWKDDDTNTPQVGLIAQDVQKVLPEVVKTNKDGYLGVSYTEIIPLLVAAIQDLKAELDAYKASNP